MEEQAIKKIKLDYEDVFSSVKGQRVLKDIALSGVMMRSAFSTDTLVMAANCAKQDFARHIIEMATPQPSETKKVVKAIRKHGKAARKAH